MNLGKSAGTQALMERHDALGQLQDLARHSAEQRGQLALVFGEAGIGKSSLLEAFAQRQAAPAVVAWGRCDDLFTPRQLAPFYDLAPVLGPRVQSALALDAKPESGQGNLFAEVLSAISRLPAGSVLIFEDLHWADHATLDLLKFVARRIAVLRVLLLLSYREVEPDTRHPLTQLLGDLPSAETTRLALQPLSAQAVEQLAVLHGRDGAHLYRATGGNPFFLSEIIAQQGDAAAAVPVSVRDAVLARLARVSAPERELLQALSVAPDPLSEAVIRRLTGEQGMAAAQACEARGLLLRDANGRLRFRHELARMATLEALPGDVQQRHQGRLLQVYVGMGEEVPPDLLVHHAAAVGDWPLLLQHAPRAARRAAALGAHKEAASHLATALRHIDQASEEQAALLLQDWAYEMGLFEVNESVLEARREAVRRWQRLGRADRVGDNLRWLWRLHWYRGEVDAAEKAAAQAIEVLEGIAPSAELAQAYALRSHMHLLKGQRSDAIRWGQRALDLAQHFGDVDCQSQALVSVATAMLFGGDDKGCAPMEQALHLALAHGLHEQAARVYTNYSEYAIVVRNWALADELVLDGLAFDIKHHLESWTGYLAGRHAQLRLEQGRLFEAQTLASGALAVPKRTLLMLLPAMTTLAIAESRLGSNQAPALLDQALQAALSMREQQRLTPVRLGLIEHHYLASEPEAARAHVQALLDFGAQLLRPWDAGALRVWAARLRVPLPADVGLQPTPAQALELAGDLAGAAALLDKLQAPFDAALCRLVAAAAAPGDALDAALAGFAALSAQAGVRAVERCAAAAGLRLKQPKKARGPYRAARSHPLGLTKKELQVLNLLAEGANNADIAQQLSRSPRTVEHHVSSILGKLKASNRVEAILRVMAEPWIVAIGLS